MKLGEAILMGDVRAYGQLSDLIRERGGTYHETFLLIREIHTKAGRTPPDEADFEDKMAECEEQESKS